jgi:CotH kinase protein/VTC domain
MPRSPVQLAESFPAIGLAELDAAAALRDRVDAKYVVPIERFAELAPRLCGTHSVLEIDGRRAFRYRTTYFDTAELRAYRDHLQQRRRRYKCRSREYVDSGACSFEVKLKGPRGRTIKHRMAYDSDLRDEISEPALEFVRDCLERAYGRTPDGELRATLAMAYTRVTFVAPGLGERLTCDYDLAFSASDGASGRLAEDLAIVESKSPRGNAVADRALRALGARPEPGCSKYCLGVGFTNPRVKSNGLRPLLRRHFRAAPAAAVALALGAAPAAAELPRVDIRAAQTIRDEPKVAARLTAGGRSHRVGIELRGQASQRHPKRPYRIETKRKVRLLGMPRERDWDLNAYYTDPTLLRDVLAHAAARRMGLAASRTRHVELWLNRRYRGVYVLIEPPELSDRRVQGDALLELTGEPKLDRGDDSFRSATGRPVRHFEPDEAGKPKARAARRAVRAFEAVLGGPGWRAHLDEDSAVDYVLHAELLKNQDAFYSSTYLHQRKDGKLALGPVWDFDLSAGNTVDPAISAPEGWLLTPDRPWAGALLADTAFRAALAARWRTLRESGLIKELLRAADRHAASLRAPAARNFARWPTLDTPVFRNQSVHGSHPAALAALRDWLIRRAAWLDEALTQAAYP